MALLVAVTPVLGFVCQMDCDRPLKPTCHETIASFDGPTIGAVHHACDHDHTGARAALVGSAGVREAVGPSFVSNAPTPFGQVAVPGIAAMFDMHGPPGPSARSVSSRTTVLRI
jgi:hypothetical protein